jgi:hypothetical protein
MSSGSPIMESRVSTSAIVRARAGGVVAWPASPSATEGHRRDRLAERAGQRPEAVAPVLADRLVGDDGLLVGAPLDLVVPTAPRPENLTEQRQWADVRKLQVDTERAVA